jgi:hypothetical protein
VTARDTVRLNGVIRTLLGVFLVAAPGPFARVWMGSRGELASRVLGRTHGIRDVALGAGLVWAVDRDEPDHAWVTGAAVCDLLDAGVTVAFWDELPRVGRWLVLALAGSSAVQMGVLAARGAR